MTTMTSYSTSGASEAIKAEIEHATEVRDEERKEEDDEDQSSPWEDDEGIVPLRDNWDRNS